MPCSVQDSARALRADCETAASSPTDGGPAASPQEDDATAYPAPLRLRSRRRPARRAGAAVIVHQTSPPVNARVESLSRSSSSDNKDVVDDAGSPRTPRRLRHVQRTITQLNAAAAAAAATDDDAAIDGDDLRRRSQPDRQTDMPQPLRISRSVGAAGRPTTPSPPQHEVSPEWLALRDEVDDVTHMVDELLEVGEDGERKYRLT